ncbi:SpoIIE family protein phosphatase [Streptomyces griseomycini]|uniref:Serine phosphatase RsbU (Regulator of sigma subunit) n=1 Tax=Streptomyces griseomycini TaxID=66895 RepID=A0A7W7PU57_9ACTN|nr:SpoIIE family protein phosphatase [Streptomyces griseomycini]MBB4901359.1 serine phosphatase RsbU (regulator of sigma subunit) [Streptomyces griseomycini]GGR24190.1 transcription antitermination regulator [Streptomyces griseomycini]
MSEPATPADSGAAPDLAELARVVARQRAEMDRLREQAASSAVVERAKGVVMALTGCSADAAGETLLQRAKAARRTLLEECWITLGRATLARSGTGEPPAPSKTAVRDAASGLPGADPPAAPSPPDDVAAALGRLGRALVHADTAQELARCLLEHLAPDLGADSVMIYARRPGGGLALVGHAGIGGRLATRWRQVPPFSGVALLDALRSGAPLWLEDFAEDSKRYLLIGEPPERWRSRAWLPVPAGDGVEACVGVLRERSGPFTPRDRTHLREVARLCAGRLRTLVTPPAPTADAPPDAVRPLFEALPVAAVLLTPLRGPSGETTDFRIDAATAQAATVLGGPGVDPAGRRLLEYRPGLADEPLWQGCLTTLATGEPYEGEPFAHQEVVGGVAALSTYSVRVARLEDSLVVTWARHASSDRQEQRLADLQRLGNLGWANWNLATLEASWSSQVFAILDRDPADGPVRLVDLPGLAVPDDRPVLGRAVGGLVHEGSSFDVPFRVRTPRGVRHLRLVAEALADLHGTPVEVHGFVQDLTARRRAELALVESERAILTQNDVLQAERTLVARLQNALLPLPRRPVNLAGLRVEVAYLPSQAGIHVGGDWFSAIELPDGDALFVVGDVAGHGIGAVATMAQLRFTAKGMVITGSSLTGALARLNTLLLHSRDTHRTATMVLARYQPGERRLVWAQAGHTPPLLLRDGEVTYLRRPDGMLLGASAAPRFEEAECRLRPGDRLLLYTDGLVERPPENIDAGLDRLAEAVAAHPDGGSGSLGALLDTMLEGERRDDVCVLDIRFPGKWRGRPEP